LGANALIFDGKVLCLSKSGSSGFPLVIQSLQIKSKFMDILEMSIAQTPYIQLRTSRHDPYIPEVSNGSSVGNNVQGQEQQELDTCKERKRAQGEYRWDGCD
jgi:hypothetical protein